MLEAPETISGNKIPAGEKLYKPAENHKDKPRLFATHCLSCGEVIFPVKLHCPNCCSNKVEEILIGPRGKLYSFTIVYQSVPDGYQGPVPYGVVKVEMPEGVRITGYSTENDPQKLIPGMEMEIIIDRLFIDEKGKEVMGFKFKPVNNGNFS